MMIFWKWRWSVQVRRIREDLIRPEEGKERGHQPQDQGADSQPEVRGTILILRDKAWREILKVLVGETHTVHRLRDVIMSVMPPGHLTPASLRQVFSRISGSAGTRTETGQDTGDTGTGAEVEATPGYRQ